MLTLFLPYNLTNNKSCYESCRLAFSSRRRWSAEVHLKKLLAKLFIPLEVWPCPRITQRHRQVLCRISTPCQNPTPPRVHAQWRHYT